MHIFSAYIRYKTSTPKATAVRCGFDSRSIRGAASQRSKFGDRRQSFDLKSPSVRLKASSGLPREMTVRSKAWGVLSLEPNVPSESTCVYSAEISVLRKAARVRCSSTPVRLEAPRKLSAGNGREFLGSGSFLSTVVRSEVAGRSAGIDWRRGFDPIDRSISVDSRTIFSSLIHQGFFCAKYPTSGSSKNKLKKHKRPIVRNLEHSHEASQTFGHPKSHTLGLPARGQS